MRIEFPNPSLKSHPLHFYLQTSNIRQEMKLKVKFAEILQIYSVSADYPFTTVNITFFPHRIHNLTVARPFSLFYAKASSFSNMGEAKIKLYVSTK